MDLQTSLSNSYRLQCYIQFGFRGYLNKPIQSDESLPLFYSQIDVTVLFQMPVFLKLGSDPRHEEVSVSKLKGSAMTEQLAIEGNRTRIHCNDQGQKTINLV